MDKIQKLIDLYVQADERLRAIVISLEKGNWSRRRKEELQQQIEVIISELTDRGGGLMADGLADSYKAGTTQALESIFAQGIASEAVNTTLKPLIHQQAVQAIMDEAFYSIMEASDYMSADVKQRIEDAVRLANERSLVRGVSRRSATRQAVAELAQRGITGMVARNGAQIPADKYIAGVVQYHQRKAHVTGAENMITQNGMDLVYVNYVGITCEFCSKYQGRVYSISGADGRFPKLEKRPPYHAHCVHSISAWVEEYQGPEETQRMIEQSTRPFVDNRTEHAIERYEERQRDKSRKNEVRKMWMRYKTRMPGIPSLRTFASQKARGTTQFLQWQEDYLRIGRSLRG